MLAVLAAIITVVMTTLLFCCWRRKEVNKAESAEKVGEKVGDTPAGSQNGKLKEGDPSANGPEVHDFAAVQRETEILRPYRKPPPPKNRGRQSRAGRAMTRSTEHLDVFGEINEEEDEEPSSPAASPTSPDIKAGVTIVLTQHPDSAEASEEASVEASVEAKEDVTLRDKTGKEDETRDARSSMLADIEQTLASMRRQSADGKSLDEPALTPVETVTSGDKVTEVKHQPGVSGVKADVAQVAKPSETEVEKDQSSKLTSEVSETAVQKDNSVSLESKPNAETTQQDGKGSESTDTSGPATASKVQSPSASDRPADSRPLSSPGQAHKKGPKVSPKPNRLALAKAGITANKPPKDNPPPTLSSPTTSEDSEHESAHGGPRTPPSGSQVGADSDTEKVQAAGDLVHKTGEDKSEAAHEIVQKSDAGDDSSPGVAERPGGVPVSIAASSAAETKDSEAKDESTPSEKETLPDDSKTKVSETSEETADPAGDEDRGDSSADPPAHSTEADSSPDPAKRTENDEDTSSDSTPAPSASTPDDNTLDDNTPAADGSTPGESQSAGTVGPPSHSASDRPGKTSPEQTGTETLSSQEKDIVEQQPQHGDKDLQDDHPVTQPEAPSTQEGSEPPTTPTNTVAQTEKPDAAKSEQPSESSGTSPPCHPEPSCGTKPTSPGSPPQSPTPDDGAGKAKSGSRIPVRAGSKTSCSPPASPVADQEE